MICVFLCMLLLALTVLPAAAASPTAALSLTADSTVLTRGAEVCLSVRMSNCEKCRSVGLAFEYDTDTVFDVENGTWLLSGTTLAGFDTTTTKAGIAGAAWSTDTDANGTVFRLKLKVKETAPYGNTTVKVTPSIKNGSKNIACASASLNLTVGEATSDQARLTVETDMESVGLNKVVSLTVHLENCAKCRSVGFAFDYDTDRIFEIESSEWLFNGTVMSSFDTTATKAGIAAASFAGDTDVNGDVFRLKLKVKETAPYGNTTVKVTPSIKNGNTVIGCFPAEAELKILPQIPGDLDNDGNITNADITLLIRYLSGWLNVPFDRANADLDSNGKLNNRDAILMIRIIAGWD